MNLKKLFSKKEPEKNVRIGSKNNTKNKTKASWSDSDFRTATVDTSETVQEITNLNTSTNNSILEIEIEKDFELTPNKKDNILEFKDSEFTESSLTLEKNENVKSKELDFTDTDFKRPDELNLKNFENEKKSDLDFTDTDFKKPEELLEFKDSDFDLPNNLNAKTVPTESPENNLEQKTILDNSRTEMIDENISLEDEINNNSPFKNMLINKHDLTTTINRNTLDIPTRSNVTNLEEVLLDETKEKQKFKLSDKLSLLHYLPLKTQYLIFFSVLAFGSVGIGTSIYLNTNANKKEAKASTLSSSIWGENQKVSMLIRDSIEGKSGSFDAMVTTWKEIEKIKLELSATIGDLSNEKISTSYSNLDKNFELVRKNILFLKANEELLKDTNARYERLIKQIDELNLLINKLTVSYIDSGVSASEITHIYNLKIELEKIKSITYTFLKAEKMTIEDIAILEKSKDTFKNLLADINYGSEDKQIKKISQANQPIYLNVAKNWLNLSTEIEALLEKSNEISMAKQINVNNQLLTDKIHTEIKEILAFYDGYANRNAFWFKNLLVISSLLLIISLVGLIYVYSYEKERIANEIKTEAEKNNKAVFRMVSELGPLQRGDLTKSIVVEQGITQSIADAVNQTIDSLALVVKKIKNTSLVISEKTNDMSVVSLNMLSANETQANSIINANDSIMKISKAINDISTKTKLSLETAQKSTNASNVGAKHVKDSIESMSIISKNMNETVDLMSKVSDSSKQISEVINLLSDITEETNILALNASVQAAKAGEAGNGFKVVADSIQGLADNAAEATRRVGALIATVQTDIKTVGLSIEKTTNEVQKGVHLSENAGESLEEINHISNELAEIVKTISKEAIVNAESARKISENMEEILKVTEETKKSNKKSTTSITEIAEMSNNLSHSVQSFIVD